MREFLGNVYNDTLLVGDMSMVPDVSGIEIDITSAIKYSHIGDFVIYGMHGRD